MPTIETEAARQKKLEAARRRARRRRAFDQFIPKLKIASVDESNMVKCELESSRGRIVHFKFDFTDAATEEITGNLVRSSCICLKTYFSVHVKRLKLI